MDENDSTVEFSKPEEVNVTYKTNKGKVRVTFYHYYLQEINDKFDSSSVLLMAEVKSKPKLSLKYKNIAKAGKEVYLSFGSSDNNVSKMAGETDFLANVEKTKFTHSNPEIVSLIEHAQKDVIEQIPYERQKRAEFTSQKTQEKQKNHIFKNALLDFLSKKR